MTKAFVHGVPETAAIWGPLLAALAERGVDDTVTLSPPGFGASTPDGWSAEPGAYTAWLADELGRIDGPVDLVGHDWGTGHVLGLLAERPDTVRSWTVDVIGLVHPDYVWHDMAQTWQTDGAGEEAVALFGALPTDDLAGAYQGLGMPADVARAVAEGFDDEMARCILTLYRAARQPWLAQLGERLVAADLPPGSAIDATDDPYVASSLTSEFAERLGLDVARLDGESHWWMLSAPDRAAEALIDFWSGLDGSTG